MPARPDPAAGAVPPGAVPPGGGVLDGPWAGAFWFVLPGPVRSKSNFRRYRGGRRGSGWGVYASFEAAVAAQARQHRPPGWELGDRAARLAARPAVVSFVYARSTLDAGNLSKSVLDAVEGIVYWNDASVRFDATLGTRTTRNRGGVAAFARLAPDASPAELLAAGAALAASAYAAAAGAGLV